MNDLVSVFDPALTSWFLQTLNVDDDSGNNLSAKEDNRYTNDYSGSGTRTGTSQVFDSRSLFYQLNQPNQFQNLTPLAYGFVKQGLITADQVYSPLLIPDYSEEQLSLLKLPAIDPIAEQLQTAAHASQCLNQLAAIELTQPCWLQNVFQISCSQSDYALQLMTVYKRLTGSEQGEGSITQLYSALLLETGAKLPVLYHQDYSRDSKIPSAVFEFASTQLALALFPRVLFAEILGFTLAYCQMPSMLEVCIPGQLLTHRLFQIRQQRLNLQLSPLLACIKDYINQFPTSGQALWHRIQQGYWLYQLRMQDCRDQLNKTMNSVLSPEVAVSQLFQQKAMAANGHHQKIQLGGQSLDSWFSGMPGNNSAFLQALLESKYVNKKQPSDSLLLKLFDFNGPMYGVLDQSERQLLKNWLQQGVSHELSAINKAPEKAGTTVVSGYKSETSRQSRAGLGLNYRQLYYQLVNADLFPGRLFGLKQTLRNLFHLCSFFNSVPFKHYSHTQLDSFIEAVYQREMAEYQPLTGRPKISREAYVWGIEQIAPMILIDGCWLQNSLAIQKVNADIGDILFKIYCDETGNGQLEQNHPYIFQQLLNSLSIAVPPVHSKAFIQHKGFINSAFDLPVYMLALSRFSIEFLPELLGLNMAIEISGLGKGYMSLVDDWNYWGINPAIANIHISIDNYASGHTFLAKKAIQLYMDDVLKQRDDRRILDIYWRRVYCGYASLRFVGARFRLALPTLYLLDKFKREVLIAR